MAREYAQLRPAMWADDDYTDLSFGAQWLYEYLLTSPSLTFAGVADWRPGRIAQAAKDATPAFVEAAAGELQAGQFILIDRTTEEVLIRSFAKHDGLLKQPKMAVAFAKAVEAMSSKTLRQVLVGQLVRLRKSAPDLRAWDVPAVSELLDRRALSFDEGAAVLAESNPTVYPSVYPSGSPSGSAMPEGTGSTSGYPPVSPAPTPAPQHQAPQRSTTSGQGAADAATTTARKPAAKRGTRIPDPFPVTTEMVAWARAECPGLDHKRVTDAFVDYWRAKPGHQGIKLDWVATWRNWLRREAESQGFRPGPASVSAAAAGARPVSEVDPYGFGPGIRCAHGTTFHDPECERCEAEKAARRAARKAGGA
ncbi:hypothetical protein [Xylanimonas oleitrophica]|nr:hypothetical protein [Xylanimonas oleitrophica]